MKKTWQSTRDLLFGAAVVLWLMAVSGCALNKPSLTQDDLPTSFAAQSDQQKRAGIRLQLAIGYYEQRQMAVALDEVKQALQADPNFADAYSVRALIFMEMGEKRLAEENFLHAIKLAPNNPEISNNYGWFLCQNGSPDRSIAYFEATLKSRTYQSPAKALNNAGVCSLKLKDVGAAEKYFLRAFQFDPGNNATAINLAKIHYDRGDYERARFYIGRVLKADQLTADVLWLAIKVEHKLGDRAAELSLATQLRRRYSTSPEYALYQRGAFDE